MEKIIKITEEYVIIFINGEYVRKNIISESEYYNKKVKAMREDFATKIN